MALSSDIPAGGVVAGSRWIGFFAPINIAAYATWAAVSITVLRRELLAAPTPRDWSAAAALVAMLLLFLWRVARDRDERSLTLRLNLVAQAVLIVLADYLLGGGQPVVLLIIVAAQVTLCWPARYAIGLLALCNGLVLWHWSWQQGDFWLAALQLLPLLAFQAFAALTAHYAAMAERSRSSLSQINAELLATQQLLQESARTDERLKLSRELHDVSGHKLTALKLHLTRLGREPALGSHAEIATCAQLAEELLADLRGVVGALRQHDGLEFAAALRALAGPLGGTRIDVEVPGNLRVDSVARADALLRAAQEGITNALRHGSARHVRINCRHTADGLLLEVTNDGARPASIRLGNGLTGMQERLLAVGGRMSLDVVDADHAVQLRVWLPEARQ